MIARIAGLFTICMLAMGAALVPEAEMTPALEFQAASRAVSELEQAVALRPALADAHALIVARVRVFVVSEWLEAVWAAIRSVLEHGSAWSRELLSVGVTRCPGQATTCHPMNTVDDPSR